MREDLEVLLSPRSAVVTSGVSISLQSPMSPKESENFKLAAHILNSLPIAAYAKGRDGSLLYMNKRGREVLQLPTTFCENLNDSSQYWDEKIIRTEARQKNLSIIDSPLTSIDGKEVIGSCSVLVPNDTPGPPSVPEESHQRNEELSVDSCDGGCISVFENATTEEKNPFSIPLNGRIDSDLLLQHMPVGFSYQEIVRDENGKPIDYRFLLANPKFEEMTGLGLDSILGKLVTEAIPSIRDDPAMWIERYGEVVDTRVPWTFEQYSPALERWFTGTAFRTQGDEFVILFLEITETKHVMNALRESEEQHRNLFESMVQGVVYQDSSGYIISANPSVERLLGLTTDQMRGQQPIDPRWKSIRDDGSDFPFEEHPSMVALATGKPVTNVLMGVFVPQHNEHRWISIDSVPRFREGESKPFEVYTTFTDFTETKKVESTLKTAKEKAEEADKLKSQFLANMSHEVRTPLNGILGNLQLCLLNGLTEDTRAENLENLQIANQSGMLLLSILQDILDLSKLEAGQVDILIQPFYFPSMMDQVTAVGKTLLLRRESPVHLTQNVSQELCKIIEGDEFRLMQVLNNLVSNACKFTTSGSIVISADLVDNKTSIEFCVRDTGKGIAPSFQEIVFQPFLQVDASDTRMHGGTGLGLTISMKLVGMMGGKMWLESCVEPGRSGSAFYFTIPFKVSPDNGSLQKLPGRQVSGRLHVQGQKTVLLVEDDKVSRKVASKMLERAGCTVLVACDGLEAIDVFDKNKGIIDLILMDVQMPLLGGLKATERIRRSGHADNLPIIALSAGAMKGDREKGLEVGMTDYLTKPITYSVLLKTMDKYLGPI